MKNIFSILLNKLKEKLISLKSTFLDKLKSINKNEIIDILFQIFLRIISLIFASIIIYIYSQFFCDGKFVFEKERMKLNFILVYFVIAFFYCLTGRTKPAILITMILTFILGFINHFITAFRGTPLVPWDIFSINVALSVLPTFKFTITKKLFFGILFFIFGIVLLSQIQFKTYNIKKINIICRILLFILIANFAMSFYFTDMIFNYKLDENWDPKEEYHNNGLIASLFKQSKNLIIEKPENYNFEYIYELAQSIEVPIKESN